MIFVDLIINLSLLVALSVISGFIGRRWPEYTRPGVLLQGVLFGGIAVIGMLHPLNLGPGLIFDGRSVMVSLCALFFGPWAASVAFLMTAACRLSLGGAGMFTGVLVILSSVCIGLAAHFRENPQKAPPSTLNLYLFGILVHLAMLAMMFTLPGGAGLSVVKGIGLPVLLLYPLATILAGKILSDHISITRIIERLRESEVKFRDTITYLDEAYYSVTLDGVLLDHNRAFNQILGINPALDMKGRLLPEFWQDKNERAAYVDELTARGFVKNYIIQARKISGEKIFAMVNSHLVKDEKNNPLRIDGSFTDITEQKKTEELLRLEQFRMKTLLKLNEMTGASLQELTNFCLEESVRLTRSKIGYFAFVNDDETVMTMHAWSKNAMQGCAIQDKPLIYPVVSTGLWGEAIRQRKAVITNDYAAPNPLEKGSPEGHVKIMRHMNTPIIDKGKIVIVAGVGNKDGEYDESDVNQLTLLMQGMWGIIQRRQTQEEIYRLNEALEQKIAERTAELKDTVTQLEETNRVFVGRELKMAELKKRIAELETK